tara:strand:+ start:363 stop:593 length:231 start_codon:yes stop_codon:yes gene_type:complete
MAGTEIQVNEQDIAGVLQKKVNETVNLQLQIEAMARTIAEKNARIDELEGQVSSPNGKESSDAKSGKEEVSIHDKR